MFLFAIFRFPEENKPENIIDLDDLTDEDFFVACLEDKNENKFSMFIWKGSSVQVDSEESKVYIEKIKNIFFTKENIDEVQIIEEVPYSESDDFMSML